MKQMSKMISVLIHVMARNGCPELALGSLSGILKQQFRLRGVHIFVNRSLRQTRMLIVLLSFLVVQVVAQSRPSNGSFSLEGCIFSSPEL